MRRDTDRIETRRLLHSIRLLIPLPGAEAEPLDRAAFFPIPGQIRYGPRGDGVLPGIDVDRLRATESGHHLIRAVELALVL